MITDSEKFKLNLIKDMNNPYSSISRIRRCMTNTTILWAWNNEALLISELKLKLIFNFDNSISFVDCGDEKIDKNDKIFDISKEAETKYRIFVLESTYFGRTSISFELDNYLLDIENNRLVFRFIETIDSYTFKYNLKKGIINKEKIEKLPIYDFRYRTHLENTEFIYCLAYLNEQQQAHLKNMKWPANATPNQLEYINQIKSLCGSLGASTTSWHHYLVSRFLEIGSFEESVSNKQN